MKPLTDDERWVLAHQWHDALEAMALGAAGVQRIRDGHGSGGNIAWHYEVRKNGIDVEHYEWGPDPDYMVPCGPHCQPPNQWWPGYPGGHYDGMHAFQWKRGPLIRAARITLPRLQAWAEALPAPIRERASAICFGRPHRQDAGQDLVQLALDDTRMTAIRAAAEPVPADPITHYPGELVGQEALF